jgi:hypothetical protein
LNLDTLIQLEQQPGQIDTQGSADKGNEQEGEEEEQEFEFRLFSAPVRDATTTGRARSASKSENNKDEGATAGTQKLRIRLRSPTPGAGGLDDGRFVNPFRGWEYYFSAPKLLSGSKEDDPQVALRRKQFEEVAVSGQQMGEWAKVPWVCTPPPSY